MRPLDQSVMSTRKVLAITGGRYTEGYRNLLLPTTKQIKAFWLLWRMLNATHLANGFAVGTDMAVRKSVIDTLGRSYVLDYPVNTVIDGPWPRAGHKRNRRMLVDSQAVALVAFPGGRGTLNCAKTAVELGIDVYQWDGEREDFVLL